MLPKKVSPFAAAKASIVSQLGQTKKSDIMSKFQETLTAFYLHRIKYAHGYEPPSTTAAPPATTSVLPGG